MKIKGRHSNYLNQLSADKQWVNVKRLVRIRDGHRCRVCGSRVNLDVHHTTYTVGGKSIVGREYHYMSLLITLCRNCHEKAHGKTKCHTPDN